MDSEDEIYLRDPNIAHSSYHERTFTFVDGVRPSGTQYIHKVVGDTGLGSTAAGTFNVVGNSEGDRDIIDANAHSMFQIKQPGVALNISNVIGGIMFIT